MGETLHLTRTLEPRGPAGALVFTDDEVAAMGDGGKTFAVTVTIGETTLPLRLARMGGESLVGFSKAARAQAGVDIGDEVTFTITADSQPREVEVPDDLAAALDEDASVRSAFDGLAYTHRRSFVSWVTDAKREQTRADRVAKTVAMVRAGETR